LFLGLIMLYAYLRYRRAAGTGGVRRLPWLATLGAASGWCAITRPVDAIALTFPIAVALVLSLRRASPKTILVALAVPTLAATPFLAIQAALNYGATGHCLRDPATMNLNRDTPGGAYGFHPFDPNAHAHSVTRQKQLDYDLWAVPFLRNHRPGLILHNLWKRRLPEIADATLPARAVLILLPIGALGLRGQRWVLFATLPAFLVGYVPWAFFVEHYGVVMIPPVVLLVTLAVQRLRLTWPPLGSAALAFTAVLALTDCYEFNHAVWDEPFVSTWLRELHNTTESHAIILFTFDFDPSTPDLVQQISQEPVYNTDVAWPDDAPLIRAHDLGERNIELFRYYAERDPSRQVYRFNRRTGDVVPLGKVGDLAQTK
jgi:hypothetical protein